MCDLQSTSILEAPREIVLFRRTTFHPIFVALHLTLERTNTFLRHFLPLPSNPPTPPDKPENFIRYLPEYAFKDAPYCDVVHDESRSSSPIMLIPEFIKAMLPIQVKGLRYTLSPFGCEISAQHAHNPREALTALFTVRDFVRAYLALTPTSELPSAIRHFAQVNASVLYSYLVEKGTTLIDFNTRFFRPMPVLDPETIAALLARPERWFRELIITHVLPRVLSCQHSGGADPESPSPNRPRP